MNDEISPEVFDHLVDLAALKLEPQEAEYLRKELSNQLKSISELVNIPLQKDLPITSRGITYTPEISPKLRKDEWHPYENTESILKIAPQTEDGYFIVPDIPHKTLE